MNALIEGQVSADFTKLPIERRRDIDVHFDRSSGCKLPATCISLKLVTPIPFMSTICGRRTAARRSQ